MTAMWPLADDEYYVSIDIEADGPAPGLNSMLSLGAAAFTADGALVDTFSANLEALPEAREDPRTMRWWATQCEAWTASRTQTQDPERAMRNFNTWVRAHAKILGTPVMVAYPVSFDTMWVQWYLHRFVGDDPFRRRAIDVKTLAMVAMGKGYRTAVKARMPTHWHAVSKHTHIAVDDAIEQGELFMNIVRELNSQFRNDAEGSQSE